MTSPRLSCVRNFLKLVVEDCSSAEQTKALLSTATKEQIKAITEIFHNIVHGNLKLSKSVKRIISRHRRTIHSLAKDRISLEKRKRLFKKHFYLIIQILRNIHNLLKLVW